jgi:hypothetical protein
MNQSETKELSKQHRLPMLWATARDELAARRASHVARKRLAAEMADYTSQSDRNDLNALLDSYPDDQVTEIRDILNQRIAA